MPGPMNTMGSGQNFAFPDVCNTPVPPSPSPIPIPYPNMATHTLVNPATTAKTILVSCLPTHNQMTMGTVSQGDNPGVLLGVASGMVMGPCEYTMGSTSIMLEGMPAVSLATVTGQNGMSENCPGTTIVPDQATVMAMS